MSSVVSVIKRFNLNPKKARENTVLHNYFDNIDTDRKAYFLGFFVADGCINKYTTRTKGRFGFNIQNSDRKLLEVLKEEIKCPNNITTNVAKN
jgi:hypothetical protein